MKSIHKYTKYGVCCVPGCYNVAIKKIDGIWLCITHYLQLKAPGKALTNESEGENIQFNYQKEVNKDEV